MFAQTAIIESHVKVCTGSPCRVLQGNEDPTVSVTTKSCSATKYIVYMPSGKTEISASFHFAYDGTAGIDTTPAGAYWRPVGGVRTDYSTFNAFISDVIGSACSSKEGQMFNGPFGTAGYNNTWDFISTVSGLNNYITRVIVSDPGGELSGKSWYDAESYNQWGEFSSTLTLANLPPQNDPTTNPSYSYLNLIDEACTIAWFSATDGTSNSAQMDINWMTITSGGTIDFAGHYSFLVSAFLAESFSWSAGGFDLKFKEWPNVGTATTGAASGNLVEASSYFDLSDMVTAGNSVRARQVGHCTNGWSASDNGFSSVVAMRQLAKFNAVPAIVRPYFIGRYRGNLNQNPGFASGSVTESIIDIISSGQIFGGQTIGMTADGADINMDFPSDLPFPIGGLGSDSAVMEDYYFAVIGGDPSQWAAANGFTLGTKMG